MSVRVLVVASPLPSVAGTIGPACWHGFVSSHRVSLRRARCAQDGDRRLGGDGRSTGRIIQPFAVATLICAWCERCSDIGHVRTDPAVSADVLDELFSVPETGSPNGLSRARTISRVSRRLRVGDLGAVFGRYHAALPDDCVLAARNRRAALSKNFLRCHVAG